MPSTVKYKLGERTRLLRPATAEPHRRAPNTAEQEPHTKDVGNETDKSESASESELESEIG